MAEVVAPLAGPSSVSLGSAAIQMAVALLLILAVILLAYWMLRKFGPRFGLGGGSSRAFGLRVEGHLTLGPRKNIMVVRFLNRLLVLGVTDQSITLLTEADQDDDSKDFKTFLDEASGTPPSGGPGPSDAPGGGASG